MFRSPQVNLYSRDLPTAVAFYTRLGFTETFRYPSTGDAEHVELTLGDFHLGIATLETAVENHGLSPNVGGRGMELVLWTDDVDAAFARLTTDGARPLSAPHDWLADLRLAWIADPDANPIQLVEKRADDRRAPGTIVGEVSADPKRSM
jgi:catechol 2,3-dioxygenase-like lactoylglutathione lyase family enzyme